jgi:hypothetical protein
MPFPADLRLYYQQRSPPVFRDAIDRPIQSYFPSLETLFPSLAEGVSGSPTLVATELATEISGGFATIENLTTRSRRDGVPIWIRPVHLLEPLECMEGEYVMPNDGALPAPRGAWQKTLRKLNDPFNEAYTDAVFACMASRLVETGRSPHWCRFYGTFNGRAPTYKYTITDDLPDIEDEDWYRDGLKSGAFEVWMEDPYDPTITERLEQPLAHGSRRILGDAGSSHDADSEKELDSGSEAGSEGCKSKSSAGELEEVDIALSGEVATLRRPPVRLSSRVSGSVSDSVSASGSGSGSDSSSGSEESDDLEYKLLLRNFPVQMTVLERCEGTMDNLMEDEVSEEATPDMRETKEQRWTAWMFQVIAGLTTAQQFYDFIHNDLHTNNVMWSGTGETHLYYHVVGAPGGDRFYRVPTYGRIMKIIDFGRATFRPPTTNNRMWFPDSYAPGGDAWGQYNCGPYFDQTKPKVLPNKSFDLARLAVAVLDTLWPELPPTQEPRKALTREPGRIQNETQSPLWNLLWLWLTDRHGKNILWNPDGSDRYPEFDLYCAIASDVHGAVPAQQLTLPLFDAAFRVRRKDIPADATIWKLQAAAAAAPLKK